MTTTTTRIVAGLAGIAVVAAALLIALDGAGTGRPVTQNNPEPGSTAAVPAPTGVAGAGPDATPAPITPPLIAADPWTPTGGSVDPGLLGNSFTSHATRGAGGPPQPLGPTPGTAQVDFSLVLRLPGEADLDAYLAGLYDPASPNFHHFLTAPEFGARFGLPPERIDRVVAWAEASGFDLLARYDQRTALLLRGQADAINRLFGITLHDLFDPRTGVTFHTFEGEAHVPPALTADVEAVAGLRTPPAVGRRVVGAALPGGPKQTFGTFGPVELARAYDIEPLYEAGITGEGQTIAIVSFDTFFPSDIEAYDREFGIQASPVERISVAGGVGNDPGPGQGEVTLDIQVVRAIAPRAKILNFESSNFDFAELVDSILQDGRAKVISNSWGVCDATPYLSNAERTREERSFQAMAAAGVTMYVASGDWGAYDCWNFNPKDHRVSVDWPSNSAFTTAVGGTYLVVREDGTYLREFGWEDWLGTGGTGGGNSPAIPRPDWQRGPGVENEWSDGRRQLPDVAAAADPDTGYAVFMTDPESGESGWHSVGGTSASAPFWAGITALFAETAQRSNLGPIGFVNPMLYELAAAAQPDTIFHDVVRGGDLLHRATPGWDYATGLGTPDVTALAAAVVEYLRTNPTP